SIDEADRFERLMRQAAHGRWHPLRDALATALHREAVAEVVREHHGEAREQLVLDVLLDVDQAAADSDAVVDVPVQHELAGGPAREAHPQAVRPFGRALRTLYLRADGVLLRLAVGARGAWA